MTEEFVTPTLRTRREDRPDIKLSDGEIARARVNFARDLGVSNDTVREMGLSTIYIGNVAYILVNRARAEIAARAKRRNEPPRVKRRNKGRS
jgi:hypothetical protein